MSFFFVWSIEYFSDGVNGDRWKGKWLGRESAWENLSPLTSKVFTSIFGFFRSDDCFSDFERAIQIEIFFLSDRIRKIEELENYKFFNSKKNKMLREDFE